MSKLLIIRHLPQELSFHDKEKLLKHFGAENVWETKSKRNYVFASFATIEKAKESMARLHQLEISQRRLVVEYSFEKEPVASKSRDEVTSTITSHVQEFLKILNAWNPSVNFYQPPPVSIKYRYPDITPKILINIIYALKSHRPLYVQTLHLLNKMCLDLPFADDEKALEYFKSTFRNYFIDNLSLIKLPDSSSESEISSGEESNEKQNLPEVSLTKRKHRLPATKKRPAAILSTATLPKVKKKDLQVDAFEEVKQIHEPKRISLIVPHEVLPKPSEELDIIGEMGKFEKTVTEKTEEKQTDEDLPIITKKELLRNRISYSNMKVLPVFKNYHPGQPSMRLYIKNLAKSVTEQDIRRIYRRYLDLRSDGDELGFDVRVMQEGRMKGQAFVTFPEVSLAEMALNETNGYMLKEKPMVVQFARVANKKTVN